MNAPVSISLELIRLEPAAYPRSKQDDARIAEFMQRYADEGPDAFPPIEVVSDGTGTYIGADFLHRGTAARNLGWTDLPAIVIDVPDGVDPVEVAHLRALETSVTAAKPLSRAERRLAVIGLLTRRPEWPDREIGRRAGVSHQTVGRIRTELANPKDRPEPTLSDDYVAAISASKISDQLSRGLSKAWDARGVTDLVHSRMPTTLAASLQREFGDEAATWAQRLERWAADARAQLERDGA
jgi:hypothetical protein